MRKIVAAPTTSWTDNFLSTELRVPSTLMQTNICSPIATNAIAGNIWDNFSSQSYKELPSVGTVKLRHPLTGAEYDYHAARRRARLHAAGIAREPLVHGAVPAEQLAGPVRRRARRSRPGCACSRRRSNRCSGRNAAEKDKLFRDLGIEGAGVGIIQRTTEDSHIRVPSGYIPDGLRPLLEHRAAACSRRCSATARCSSGRSRRALPSA